MKNSIFWDIGSHSYTRKIKRFITAVMGT
jgi:hypothetical protein